nr:hypothetical protein [Arsenicicoccus piscis]
MSGRGVTPVEESRESGAVGAQMHVLQVAVQQARLTAVRRDRSHGTLHGRGIGRAQQPC